MSRIPRSARFWRVGSPKHLISAASAPRPPAPNSTGCAAQIHSSNEREVFEHLVRGYSYREAAIELGISLSDVYNHVHWPLRKLNLQCCGSASQVKMIAA
jgi:DNA-binding CsgD family transcriptional regulator